MPPTQPAPVTVVAPPTGVNGSTSLATTPPTSGSAVSSGTTTSPGTAGSAPSSGAVLAATPPAPRALPADQLTEGRRSLRQLASERLDGFAPGARVLIEVAGARTGARFILPSVGAMDPVAVVTAIRQSLRTDATDFAWIDQVSLTDATSTPALVYDTAARADAFAAVGLPAPVTLDELDIPVDATWVAVTGSVAGYLPGTVVTLVVTSDPVVLGEAVVDRYGNATVAGAMPLQVLGSGGHQVRLVGTRVLGGIDVGDDGEVRLAPETLAEIGRFDGGTQALVTVLGESSEGATATAVRVVPLGLSVPWWTLLVVAAVVLVAAWLRRRGTLDQRRDLTVALGLVAASTGPALVLGWQAAAWAVMGWASVLALAGGAVTVLLRSRGDGAEVEGAADGEGPDPHGDRDLVPVG